MNVSRILAISILSLTLLPVAGWAQAAAPTAEKPADGGRGRPTAANMEEFRKRNEERTKAALKATDEEWTVLKPLIENVQAKQRDTYTGRGGFGRGPGGGTTGGTGGGTETPRPGQAEAQALQTTLENDASSPDDVKAKLAAVRSSRKTAQAALATAREELRKVLTVRQEAALVGMGLLE